MRNAVYGPSERVDVVQHLQNAVEVARGTLVVESYHARLLLAVISMSSAGSQLEVLVQGYSHAHHERGEKFACSVPVQLHSFIGP